MKNIEKDLLSVIFENAFTAQIAPSFEDLYAKNIFDITLRVEFTGDRYEAVHLMINTMSRIVEECDKIKEEARNEQAKQTV